MGGSRALRKLRSYETLNRWSSGRTKYFGECGPGSIPGAGTVKEILHFLQNGSTVGLEPATMQLQGSRSANCAGVGEGGWVWSPPNNYKEGPNTYLRGEEKKEKISAFRAQNPGQYNSLQQSTGSPLVKLSAY